MRIQVRSTDVELLSYIKVATIVATHTETIFLFEAEDRQQCSLLGCSY
jgi:hypothetical protein